MEELGNISSYVKSLQDIASTIVLGAQDAIKFGFNRSPYDTGNLFNQIGDYNTARRMVKQVNDETADIVFVANPPKASYGYYVVTGTSTSAKYGRRDYGTIGSNTPEVKTKIRALQNQIFADTSEMINFSVQSTLAAGFKKV